LEERGNIQAVVSILRKTTRTVKIAPFVLVTMYMLAMVGYMLFSDVVAATLDTLFYVSPLVVILLWMLSRSLKMCNWHRFECALPLVPQVPIFFDDYINQFDYAGAAVNICVVGLLFLFSLLNAYFVFIKPRNEESNS
jgi:predicted tellurium resistance membrane protein TerC